MPDRLSDITDFINTPPRVLAAGAVIAGIVWKLFKIIDDHLSPEARLKCALYVLDVEANAENPFVPMSIAIDVMGDFLDFKMAPQQSKLKHVLFGCRLYARTLLLFCLMYTLYPASLLILRLARRFNVGFKWFTVHSDIENKPISSLGFIAGPLVAILYWTAVLVSKLIHHG